MLNIVKLALRISTDAFDGELNLLIADCLEEMTAMGVTNLSTTVGEVTTYDNQVQTTVIAYCKWKFGQNEDKDSWEAIYHQKLAQLKVSTGHTEW